MNGTLERNEGLLVPATTDLSPKPFQRFRHNVALRIKTILVPLNFSRSAMQALDYATELASRWNARIHLLYVEAPDNALTVPDAAPLMRECAEAVAIRDKEVTDARDERAPQFWPENCHIRSGLAWEEICNLAHQLDVDLIVLAPGGNPGAGRVMCGRTAQRLVQFSPCPVLFVRQWKRKSRLAFGLAATNHAFQIEEILAPVDFSHCSMTGTMYGAFLAKAFGAKLHLFHAVGEYAPVVMNRLNAMSPNCGPNVGNARLKMQGLTRLDLLHDVKFVSEVRAGAAGREICRESSSGKIDLIVIATHGQTGLNRVVPGSVAEYVVRHVHCPILVVPSRY